MKNPKVSIIIPVYNGANYLQQAIDSVLAQTYPNCEVIIVNDGSTDGGVTAKIAQSFGRKIRYFEKSNGGVTSALNFGLAKMTGDYFSWLSHDDLYYPQKIERQIEFFKKCPPKTVLYSDYEFINASGASIKIVRIPPFGRDGFIPKLLIKGFIHGCTILVPKAGFEQAGLFNLKLRNVQDYEMWFRLMKAGFSFCHLPEVLIKGRQHLKQGTITRNFVQYSEYDQLSLWVLRKFNSSELFGLNQDFYRRYLEMAGDLRMRNAPRAASLAKNLSLNFPKNYRYWYLNVKYYFWRKDIVKIFYELVETWRLVKRIFHQTKSIIKSAKASSPRPRICFAGNLQSVHNQKICQFLKEKNYEIHFITTREADFPGIKIYKIVRFKFEPIFFWFLRGILKTKKLVHQIQPDILQGQALTPAGIWVSRAKFAPTIISVFGTDILNFRNYHFFLQYFIRYALHQADIVLCSAEVLKEKAIRAGARPQITRVILNGVDTDIFRPKKISHKKQKIIFCPRAIGPIYNTAILVFAFEKLISRYPDLQLALVEYINNQKYFVKIKKYIQNHRLDQKIIIWPKVPNAKMVNYYNLAEVVVSIPEHDSNNVSFLEAMACAKKIVVSDLPYLKMWFRADAQNKQGNFWKTKIDKDELSKALLAALKTSYEEFAATGQFNRQQVKQKADLKTCLKEIDKVYQQILKDMVN